MKRIVKVLTGAGVYTHRETEHGCLCGYIGDRYWKHLAEIFAELDSIDAKHESIARRYTL